MKKLIALIGAVATAFGLYAADSFSISFEGAESAKGVDASAMTFTPPSPDWKWDGDTLNIKAYGDGKMLPYGTGALARRDSSFVGEGDNDNYLTLETGTNALTRAVGGNVFLDQLVKFTGFEEYQTNVVAGTKIAVWMSGIEQEGTPAVPGNGEPEFIADLDNPLEEGGYGQKPNPEYFAGTPASDDYIAGETNLYITVGKADIMGKAEPIALKIDGTFKLDTWYRLTIKSIGNVFGESREVAPRAGFIVYIDGVQAKSLDSEAKTLIATVNEMTSEAQGFMADGALFPAIDTTDATFATVGYQGIGAIDDIILDDQGPAFAQAIPVQIIFPDTEGNPSIEVDYIDVGGVHMTYPCAVPAGTLITVYFKAVDGKKIMSDLQPQQLTVTANNFTINISDVVVEDVVAKKNRTEDLAESELYTVLGALIENDTVETISTCNVTNGEAEILYSFTPNTTITATAAGWDVFVGNYDAADEEGGVVQAAGMLTAYADIDADFALNVGFEDGVSGMFGYMGTAINGQLAITNGQAMTMAAVTVGDGALLKAANFTPGAAITLVGTGKFVTKTDLASMEMGNMIVDGDGNTVVPTANDPEEGWYTYALAIEPTPTETGFMVIIAGQSEGEVYETLAAAVEAAPAGATIKLLSDEIAVAGKCEITKNITLDLNGKTLARDNDAATLFVIKDATLTINGETAGSTLVGRLNVGDSVYNGGVRTAHWDGKLVINGGTYSVGDGQTVIHVNGDCLNAAVTINNATLTSPTDNGVQFNGKGTFAINNSTINGATAVYMKAGTLTIDKDSKINATATTWTAPVANHNGSNPTGDAIVMDSITGYQGAISLTVADGAQVTKVAEGAATIRETITDATDSTTVKIDAPTIGGIALTEAFLEKVANGSAQLPGYVAAIGTVPYPTLAAAVAAATANDTIVLLNSVAMDNALLVDGKTLTVDLKGFTITPSEKFTADYIVSIENKANVTLTNGTINLLGKMFQVKTDATATVAANTTVTGTATYMTRVWDGTLNVYGTIYHNGGSGAAVQSYADGGVINVYDGALVSAGGESNPIRCNFNNGAATINIYGGTLETRGGYTAIYAYKNGNKSVINVYGGLLLAGGSGTEANSIFAITTNSTDRPQDNCEVTVTPLDDTCTAKFNNANAKWGLALVDYCKPGYGPVKGDDGYYTIQRVYNVTIAETKNGTVETSVTNNIAAGTEVTITATPADNYELESITTNGTAITGNTFVMPAENVTVAATFKSTAQPGIIPGGDPVPVAGETEADALAEAAKLPITLTADQVSAGLTTADFCNKVRPAAGGGFEAYVEVAAANAPVIETEKTDVKPIEVGATGFSATIKNAKPGLYYGFKAVDALGTAAEFAPVGAAATATAAGDLKITAPKGEGNARFYKLTVSITNIWAE